MRTFPNNSNIFSSAYLNVVDGENSIAEARIRKHESLLTKIILGLGFNEIESREI